MSAALSPPQGMLQAAASAAQFPCASRPLLRLALLAVFAASCTATPLDEAQRLLREVHWLLRVGEELHRTFKTEHNVDVLQASGDDGRLCAKTTQSKAASRKRYEDSWTSVEVAGKLEAVFNGTCFTRSPDACVDYLECEDPNQRYRLDPNALGRPRFAPEPAALEGLHWASALAAVEAWHWETAALQAQLAEWPDDSSKKAQYLRKALTAASAAADATLRVGTDSLVGIAKQRIVSFKSYVGQDLPASLEQLAAAQEALLAKAENQPCNANTDWASLQSGVRDRLGSHGDAVGRIDASALLQPADFDYARRAVEAFAVGAGLSLQAGALAALAEFGCRLQSSPRSAAVREGLAELRREAHALLRQASDALPAPPDGSAAGAPLQRCLWQRVHAAASAVSDQALAAGGPARTLLSLDFCGRLFDASANLVIQVVPHTEAAPAASSLTFSSESGEERRVHASSDGRFAYMSPYLDVVPRGTDGFSEPDAFATEDKVLELKRMTDDNVHAAGSLPSANTCSPAQRVALKNSGTADRDCFDGTYNMSLPCSGPGCFRKGFDCRQAASGFYTADGFNEVPCPRGDLSHHDAYFYAVAWHDSSCPFVCQRADSYRSGRSCKPAPAGSYSPTCSNELRPCASPSGLPDGLFCALARFASPGRGSAQGCGASLASALALPAGGQALLPPLTAELFVKVSIDDLPSSRAVLMGTFPQWFVALRRASSAAVQIGFYHHRVTLAVSSREDSIVYSEAIPWSRGWHHVAVVVSGMDATTPNVHFYGDGELISSAQRSAVAADLPGQSCQRNAFHVGAPNAVLSPEVLEAGRMEPYLGVSGPELFYAAQIDEVRVSNAALDGLTQGARLTELRRRAACDAPLERLRGSTCLPGARLTQQHADEEGCKAGFEVCGSRPGLCVAECARGTLRQPDCTCDCPPGKFQTWYVKAFYFLGSGTVGNVTVYDTAHNVLARSFGANLPFRLDIGSAKEVAVVVVRGIGSARKLSLDVETAAGAQEQVPAYRNTPLHTDRDTILHHRRLHEFFDDSLSCATCPGDVLGSQLPRTDAMSCLCAEGYGRNLLGRCVQLKEPLPRPAVTPASGFYTAGTRVRLQPPVFFGEGPWLLEVRYTLGEGGAEPDVPTCLASPRYTESSSAMGLDIVRRRTVASLCAVTCHPMHQDSQPTCVNFTGNDHMNPPRCIVRGALSTLTTYALKVSVEFVVDGQPGATIHVRLRGRQASRAYAGPLSSTTPGLTELEAWAEQPGFDRSATAACRFQIDAAPRLAVALVWPRGAEQQERRQLGGFVHGEGAFLVKRWVDKLGFKLEARLPGGSAPNQTVELQYRLARGAEPAGDWQQVSADGAVELRVEDCLEAAGKTTALAAEWRAREPGHVWSSPAGMRFLLVAARAGLPTVEASPAAPWAVGDSWRPGPRREAALRQVHRVEMHPPTATARLLYKLGNWQPPHPLLSVSEANVSSLRSNGLIEQFRSKPTSPDWGPDQQLKQCGPDVGPSTLPTLCEYLGPFEVLAGTQVKAYALDVAQLESLPAKMDVPRELEPPRGDARFEATIAISGPRVEISSMPGVFVLPSVADSLAISISAEGAEIQSCVLASPFALRPIAPQVPQRLEDCTWLAYNGRRRLQLQGLLQKAGIADGSPRSLNVTVLATVRRPGYLWAYPRAVTYLWLRELTPPPSIVGVIEPGTSALVSAMVWLRDEAAGAGAGMLQPSGTNPVVADPPRCFFTLRNIPVTPSEIPQQWLVEVPNLSSRVQAVRDARRPTQDRSNVTGVGAWRRDLRACTWPKVCELPLNGTLPAALIQAPADLPRLCAWALWHGYGASPPTCELMGPKARVKQARLNFAPGNLHEQQLMGSEGQTFRLAQVGSDDVLGATVVAFQTAGPGSQSVALQSANATSRRLLGDPAAFSAGVPLFLERTHPLQYRHAAAAFDPAEIQRGADHLLGTARFSPWTSLDLTDPTPRVPLPSSRRPHEHTLIAVDVRLLIGINRWGQQSRSYCVVLHGAHPAPAAEPGRRSFNLTSPRANGTLLFRWSLTGPEDLHAAGGGALLRLRPDFHSISTAFAYGAGVQARLLPSGLPPERCLGPEGSELQAEAAGVLAPQLCTAPGPLELRAPDDRRWSLWAAAFGPGLALSPVVTQVVEAQCLVPGDIQYASVPPCLEGSAIDSGATCSPRCSEGYAPSAASLACSEGRPSSVTFACEEAPCAAPAAVANASALACAEGALMASGGVCTPQCAAGYSSTQPSLTCRRGRFTPSVFACTEAPCVAPGNIVHASSPSCSGLKTVASGATCITQCQEGYEPSESQLTCSRGAFGPPTFECREAACAAPSGIRYARTPACTEGDRIDPGTACTPTCQTGFKASVSSLTCSQGALSPDAFTCVEAMSAAGINLAPVLAGTSGGFVVMIFSGLLVYCLRRSSPLEEEADPDELHEMRDSLMAWWQCVREVEPGICVFCGKHPVLPTSFVEKDHGPDTTFRCCKFCAAVIPMHEAALYGNQGGGCSRRSTKAFASDDEGEQAIILAKKAPAVAEAALGAARAGSSGLEAEPKERRVPGEAAAKPGRPLRARGERSPGLPELQEEAPEEVPASRPLELLAHKSAAPRKDRHHRSDGEAEVHTNGSEHSEDPQEAPAAKRRAGGAAAAGRGRGKALESESEAYTDGAELPEGPQEVDRRPHKPPGRTSARGSCKSSEGDFESELCSEEAELPEAPARRPAEEPRHGAAAPGGGEAPSKRPPKLPLRHDAAPPRRDGRCGESELCTEEECSEDPRQAPTERFAKLQPQRKPALSRRGDRGSDSELYTEEDRSEAPTERPAKPQPQRNAAVSRRRDRDGDSELYTEEDRSEDPREAPTERPAKPQPQQSAALSRRGGRGSDSELYTEEDRSEDPREAPTERPAKPQPQRNAALSRRGNRGSDSELYTEEDRSEDPREAPTERPAKPQPQRNAALSRRGDRGSDSELYTEEDRSEDPREAPTERPAKPQPQRNAALSRRGDRGGDSELYTEEDRSEAPTERPAKLQPQRNAALSRRGDGGGDSELYTEEDRSEDPREAPTERPAKLQPQRNATLSRRGDRGGGSELYTEDDRSEDPREAHTERPAKLQPQRNAALSRRGDRGGGSELYTEEDQSEDPREALSKRSANTQPQRNSPLPRHGDRATDSELYTEEEALSKRPANTQPQRNSPLPRHGDRATDSELYTEEEASELSQPPSRGQRRPKQDSTGRRSPPSLSDHSELVPAVLTRPSRR